MPSVLDRVPGLGGYLAAQQQGQQQAMGQLQQAQAVVGLQGALHQQEQERALRAALAESGGDPEKAMQISISRGNLAGAAKLAPVVEARRKATAKQPVGAGGLYDPATKTVIPPAPRPDNPPAPPELIKLQGARKKYVESGVPEDHPFIKQIDARIEALNRGGLTINMPGSSDTVQDDSGNFYKLQIGKDGKTRIVPMRTETGAPLRPPQTPSERNAGQAAQQALTDIAEIERLGGELDALVRQNQGLVSGVVGPQGVVGRATELVTGAVGGDTPALDFRNKSKLFLSSVRKMVEKDPNLSNEERKSLTEATGDGFWQTGASSIRARQDVMNYVKTKRISGLKPTIPPAGERVKDQVYQTPRGPMKWTGTGWLPAN
jgi:hypothetical protein